MNQLIHLGVADTRRCRWMLVLWVALVVAGGLSENALMHTPAGSSAGASAAFTSTLLWLAGLALAVAFVPLAVHAQPAVGSDAFWMTRPIQPTALAASKVLLLGAALVGIPILIEVLIMAGHGVPPGDMGLVVLHDALFLGVVLVALLVVAALTPSLLRFVMVGVLLLLALSALSSLSLMDVLTLRDTAAPVAVLSVGGSVSGRRMDPSAGIMGAMVLLVAGLAVVFHQYRRRSLAGSMALAAAGLGGALLVAAAWPWPTFRGEPPAPAWARDNLASLQLAWEGAPAWSGHPASDGREHVAARAGLRIEGLPPGWLASASLLDGSIDFEDGTRIVSRSDGRALVWASSGGQAGREALRHVLAVERVATGRSGDQPAVLFAAPLDDVDGRAGRSGYYRGQFQITLSRMELAAALPLQPGAEFQDGSYRFVLDAVDLSEFTARISARTSSVNTVFDRHSRPHYEFFLRHRDRGEAAGGTLRVPRENMFIPGLGSYSVGGESLGFSRLRATIVFALWNPFVDGGMILDPEWLKGAELVIVRSQQAGAVHRALEAPGFPLPKVGI